MRSPTRHTIFAVLAIVFFMLPVGLLLVGVRADEFENRRLADAPRLKDGWDFFGDTAKWFTDQMPLREEAVRANTWISRHVFDTTPRYGERAHESTAVPAGEPADSQAPPPETASQVLSGKDGWLFLQGEIDRACGPFLPFADALGRWRELVSIVRESGRRAVLLVPPDKTLIYSEQLPAGLPTAECFSAANTELWDLLEPPASGVVGLREPLLRAKEGGDDLLYKRKDSHWNDLGALTLVRAALAAVGRGVALRPEEVTDAGDGEYTGDLTTLLGAPETDTAPIRTIARRPDAPKVEGKTLFVYDSYGDAPLPLLEPYFSEFETFLWDGSTPEALAAAVKAADTVIFESIEREFTYRASDAGYVHPRLFKVLRAALD